MRVTPVRSLIKRRISCAQAQELTWVQQPVIGPVRHVDLRQGGAYLCPSLRLLIDIDDGILRDGETRRHRPDVLDRCVTETAAGNIRSAKQLSGTAFQGIVNDQCLRIANQRKGCTALSKLAKHAP